MNYELRITNYELGVSLVLILKVTKLMPNSLSVT
jgi:hypothetical protein